MAKNPAKTAAAPSVWKSDASHISVATSLTSFWCAGLNFKAKTGPRLIAKADLNTEQAARIAASPFLAISEVTPPAEAAPAK